MNIETLQKQNADLLLALRYALEWIDAVPQDTPLPTMPGFDRDWANDLLAVSPAAEKAGDLPEPELTWLYTHCRAISMDCKSDSGKWEHDIALFTINQKARIEELERNKHPAVGAGDLTDYEIMQEWDRHRQQGEKDGAPLLLALAGFMRHWMARPAATTGEPGQSRDGSQAPGDAMDAARYRFIKADNASCKPSTFCLFFDDEYQNLNPVEDMDAAIDAAITSAAAPTDAKGGA